MGRQSPQSLLTTLDRATDRLCRCGAAVENLAHSPSFHSREKTAPSKSGIKQLSDVVWPGAAFRFTSDELASRLEAFGHNLIGRLAIQHTLASVVVGGIEAAEELFHVPMSVDCDPQHLRADPSVEALNYVVRLGRARPGMTVVGAQSDASPGEGRGEAAPVVGQHVGKLERECRRSLSKKGDGAPLGLVVLDGQEHRTGSAVCSLGRGLMSMRTKPRS